MSPEVCIIAAIASKNRVIGKDGKIPWRISADMKHFRELTTPHPVIMGRKTWDSLDARFKPLPGRPNLVVTRKFDMAVPENCWISRSLEVAVLEAKKWDDERVFIMGGGEIYQQSIDMADRLFLTLVEGDFEGDTFFPNYSAFRKEASEGPFEENGIRYKFVELTK